MLSTTTSQNISLSLLKKAFFSRRTSANCFYPLSLVIINIPPISQELTKSDSYQSNILSSLMNLLKDYTRKSDIKKCICKGKIALFLPNALESIAKSLKDGPVAIYEVSDDPRIQYPEEAVKEGIASILSVPIYVKGEIIGNMRVYTSEPWEFTLEGVNFIQAIAEISGILIDMCRLIEGQNEIIDILTKMRESVPL